MSPALERAAFALPAGSVSEPVVTDNGAAVVKVLERQDVKAEELTKQKDTLRGELLNERKNSSSRLQRSAPSIKIEHQTESFLDHHSDLEFGNWGRAGYLAALFSSAGSYSPPLQVLRRNCNLPDAETSTFPNPNFQIGEHP